MSSFSKIPIGFRRLRPPLGSSICDFYKPPQTILVKFFIYFPPPIKTISSLFLKNLDCPWHCLNNYNISPFFAIKSRFQDKSVKKLKPRRTFLGIESVSIVLKMPNIDKAVGFCYPQPFSKFQLVKSSRFKPNADKGLGIFKARIGPKIAKKKNYSLTSYCGNLSCYVMEKMLTLNCS